MSRIEIQDLAVQAELSDEEQREIVGGLLRDSDRLSLSRLNTLLHNYDYSPTDTTSIYSSSSFSYQTR